MYQTLFFACAALLVLAGCGRIDTTIDGSTVDEPTTKAYNCKSDSDTNSYGCYGSDKLFHSEKITEGIWSVYTKSNTSEVDNTPFYDRYQYGYDFLSDGSAEKQEKTDGYILYREWGVNDAGTGITVSEDGAFTYKAVFSGEDCFEVLNGSETLKLCHESYVDQTNPPNAMGYYGPNVRFGNRKSFDFEAVGEWRISGYGNNDADVFSVTLDENGTTSSGGEWGVSKDGKVIGIDGVRYLVYQYLDESSGKCIAAFEMSGYYISAMKWKLCKQ